jgi:hypothetical protein
MYLRDLTSKGYNLSAVHNQHKVHVIIHKYFMAILPLDSSKTRSIVIDFQSNTLTGVHKYVWDVIVELDWKKQTMCVTVAPLKKGCPVETFMFTHISKTI